MRTTAVSSWKLFSMGVGMDGQPNYTEDDVKACARAFTGWTISTPIPRYPYGVYTARFIYHPEDHDDGEKTFLGETGNWDGEDIVNIIAKQPATARFLSRHLYNFFMADDVQVPAWQNTPPRDPEAIKMLEDEYFPVQLRRSVPLLRVLFNSDAFKNARFAKIKVRLKRWSASAPGGGFQGSQARRAGARCGNALHGTGIWPTR